MNESLLECPVCYESYNLTKNLPRIMCCGHTLCSHCLSKMISYQQSSILKCPIDNYQFLMRSKKTACFPKNIVLIRLIERINDTIFCPQHNKKIQWICCEENAELCSECVVGQGHRMHQIKQLDINEINRIKEDKENEKETQGKVKVWKKHTQAVPIDDQPQMIIQDEIYEKIQFIKQTLIKFAGLALVMILLLKPFFKFASLDDKGSLSF